MSALPTHMANARSVGDRMTGQDVSVDLTAEPVSARLVLQGQGRFDVHIASVRQMYMSKVSTRGMHVR